MSEDVTSLSDPPGAPRDAPAWFILFWVGVLKWWTARLKPHLVKENRLGWTQTSKTGSSVADLTDHSHASLTDVLQADETSADTAGYKHVSNAQMKANKDHRDANSDVHGATGRIVGRGDLATTLQTGVVLQAAARSDSAATVTTADAAGVTYDAAEETLLNELKADHNTLVVQFNDLLAKLRTAGVLAT